jgi:hypothetical protein
MKNFVSSKNLNLNLNYSILTNFRRFYVNDFQLIFPVIRNAVKLVILSEIRVPVRNMGVLRYFMLDSELSVPVFF